MAREAVGGYNLQGSPVYHLRLTVRLRGGEGMLHEPEEAGGVVREWQHRRVGPSGGLL